MGSAARSDRFVQGKFIEKINPKDGYLVIDCKDLRQRQMLAFLVPILYPKKLARITMMVGNTIFGALPGPRKTS